MQSCMSAWKLHILDSRDQFRRFRHTELSVRPTESRSAGWLLGMVCQVYDSQAPLRTATAPVPSRSLASSAFTCFLPDVDYCSPESCPKPPAASSTTFQETQPSTKPGRLTYGKPGAHFTD